MSTPDARPEAGPHGPDATRTYRPEDTSPPGPPPGDYPGDHDRTVGAMVSDLTKDLSNLVRQEIDLAKTEAKEQATRAGKGAGMLGGAALAGYMVALFGSLFLVFLLSFWMHLAWAALIVTALWGVAAAILAMAGRKQLQRTDPKLPTTQRTLRDDAQLAKRAGKR